MKPTLKKSCKYCGKQYYTKESDKVFCNDVCKTRLSMINEQRYQYFTDKQEKEYTGWKCLNCGCVFGKKSKPAMNKIFCDPRCGYEYQFNKARIEKKQVCKVCKTEFVSINSTVFCSSMCQKLGAMESQKIHNQKYKKTKPVTEKKKRHAIPYDVLNKLAEKRRLDEEWRRLTR